MKNIDRIVRRMREKVHSTPMPTLTTRGMSGKETDTQVPKQKKAKNKSIIKDRISNVCVRVWIFGYDDVATASSQWCLLQVE